MGPWQAYGSTFCSWRFNFNQVFSFGRGCGGEAGGDSFSLLTGTKPSSGCRWDWKETFRLAVGRCWVEPKEILRVAVGLFGIVGRASWTPSDVLGLGQ